MRLWAFAFLIGILIVQQLSSLPEIYWLIAGLLVFIVYIPFPLFQSTRFESNRWLVNKSSLLLVSGLAFGFAWALGHAHWMMSHRLIAQYEGIDIIIEGRVVSLPVSPLKATTVKQYGFSQNRVSFDFRPSKVKHLDNNIALSNFPQRIRLSWYKPTSIIQAGQFWRFTVRLKRPYALMNPGGMDYESWLLQKRIQARGSVRNYNNKQLVTRYSSGLILSDLMLNFRQLILNRLSDGIDIGVNTEFIRHVTQSLILGYRGGLDSAQWQTFQRTGTIHLMAISGLHIGLVAALVYGTVALLWRLIGYGCLLLPAPQIAAIAALIAATLYAVLAGFTIPTQRALVMLLVVMVHIVFKRTPLPASKTISLALILVLLLDPLAVLAQGFWLSFFAVSLIIYLMQQNKIRDLKDIDESGLEKVTNEKSNINTVFRNIWLSILTFGQLQWALTIAMLPMVLYFYQSSSLVSPLANFIAIPMISFAVVPLMFLATVLLFINTAIANFIFNIVDVVYNLLWKFLEILANWEYSTIDFSISALSHMFFCYIAIALWLCVKGTPMRWLASLLILPVVFYSDASIKRGEAIITVLDVGQGLAAVVRTSEHTVVFDTGPKYSENFDTGRAVLIPYLRQMHRSEIDTLIISHSDNDHIGGFNSTASILPIKYILTSVPEYMMSHYATTKKSEVSACSVGDEWQYDSVQFSILSPMESIQAENGHDENNQSCVLKITTQFGSALISGDIERETESYLYHLKPNVLAADILVVPHHGSNTSSLAGFIQAVAPQYAVFTVGYKNRYHLPNKKVIQRYRQYSQSELFSSAVTGALSFRLQQDISLHPLLYRQRAKRYWHTSDITAF